MAEVSIDLGPVINAIDVVNRNMGVIGQQVDAVGSRVDAVAQEQADTRQQLDLLYKEFKEFVEDDKWAKELLWAQSHLIEVRQRLDKEYGHYDQVRRHTTGILQAVDAAIVREETMHAAVENLMLSCPRYWLAPTLVALSAWISDQRALAEKALAEALKRDDSKVSLFFSLVCRRAGRMEAFNRWLIRYFQNQNPVALDREVVVMLDALANGVFGGGALVACTAVIDEWLSILEEQAGFPDEQRKRWAETLDVMIPKVGPLEYPTLRKYSGTWPAFEAALAAVRRIQVIQDFFEQLFTGEIVVPPRLEVAVDELLDSLVKNYDDEELPLRRDELLTQLIIEERGKRPLAEQRFNAEKEALKEQSNFAAMLTNSAMYPERSGATRATQRYAVSRSRHWIIAGFNDLIARDRARVPAEADLACGSWNGKSRDGQNEQELVTALTHHYELRILQAVNAVRITAGTWVAIVIGALIGLNFVRSRETLVFGLIVLAGTGAFFFFQYQNLEKRRQRSREELGKEKDDATRILRAALAELTDLRREIAKEDAKASGLVELLSAFSSPQFILKRPGHARSVVV